MQQDRVKEKFALLQLGILEAPSKQVLRKLLRVVAVLEVAKDGSVQGMLTAEPDLMLFASFELKLDQVVALASTFTPLIVREIYPRGGVRVESQTAEHLIECNHV